MSDSSNTVPAEVNEDIDYARVPRHVWDFARDQSDLTQAARDIRRYLEELAERASIRIHTIEARAKSLTSYQEKSEKKKGDGSPYYANPAAEIHDCVAARVIVFTTRARNDLADLISLHTEVIERKNPGATKYNGYDSEHLTVSSLKKAEERARYVALGRYLNNYRGLEIQIRSVAGHAWAEYEHDIRYKSVAYQELSEDGKLQIDQWFVEAGGMRRVMDELFGNIEELLINLEQDDTDNEPPAELPEATDDGFADDLDPRSLDEVTLGELISSRFPNNEIGDSTAVQELLEHLKALDVTTVGALEVALAHVEEGQVARLMDYTNETSGARRLDDELLATFTERYLEAATGEDRKQFLRLRLRRVRGKFAIYSVDDGGGSRRLLTAANAVRQMARYVASSRGLGSASVEGAIASDKGDLLPSTNARLVKTANGPIYVATNFTRSWAESVMRTLIQRVPGSGLRVLRAGDLLFEAPDAVQEIDGPGTSAPVPEPTDAPAAVQNVDL
jgi:ppGpp synthetase/RelA/SpoT-type nucleotidyltranferase